MNQRQATATLFVIGFVVVLALRATADPTGASILSNETAGSPSPSPESRADPVATITTLVLDTTQLPSFWKAYVGNVSGRISLDNAAGFTIYDWESSGAIAGEVYVSRNSGPDFSNVTCANAANISAEQAAFGIPGTSSESINVTYNDTEHPQLVIGGFGTITEDTCSSTATFVNDTRQALSDSTPFISLILQDSTEEIIWVTFISDDNIGYDYENETVNKTYDFQLIIPDNSTTTTYYFWTELS